MWYLKRVVPRCKLAECGSNFIYTFYALLKDYKAGYAALRSGDTTKGLAAWGSINYDTRMAYTRNAVLG